MQGYGIKFMCRAIAAGLAMKLVITFETSILEEFHDQIKIVSDGGFSIEVPLHAYPPQAGYILYVTLALSLSHSLT